jgi:hypothetical protein
MTDATARCAGQVADRWGFVLGNVLMALGAPVLVTGIVPVVMLDLGAGVAARLVGGAAGIAAGLWLVTFSLRAREARAAATLVSSHPVIEFAGTGPGGPTGRPSNGSRRRPPAG